jgi:hypothetical protein
MYLITSAWLRIEIVAGSCTDVLFYVGPRPTASLGKSKLSFCAAAENNSLHHILLLKLILNNLNGPYLTKAFLT